MVGRDELGAERVGTVRRGMIRWECAEVKWLRALQNVACGGDYTSISVSLIHLPQWSFDVIRTSIQWTPLPGSLAWATSLHHDWW